MDSPEEKKKYAKPEGFKGRGAGVKSYKKYKWECVMFDKESNTFQTGKYCNKKDLIEGMGLDGFSEDHVYRIYTGRRVDKEKSKKDNSFLSKYGHIQIKKIDEPVEK
jgi:hypothetical protein